MDRITLDDRELSVIIGALQWTRDAMKSQGMTGREEDALLNKLYPYITPSTAGGSLTLNAGLHEDDPNFAVWLTPAAIRDAFDADYGVLGKRISEADDETLAAIGDMVVNGDRIWNCFHEQVEAAAEYVLLGKEA